MKFLIIVLAVLTGCSQMKCEEKTARVLSIGTCDRNGYCGVMTDAGKTDMSYPVIGEFRKIRVCYEKSGGIK